jgi:diguanylate cyclase (GGDEF)-like protein/PAS domain S-box-containing protein
MTMDRLSANSAVQNPAGEDPAPPAPEAAAPPDESVARLRGLVCLAAVALGYYVAAWLGHLTGDAPVIALWLPSGLALAAVLLWGLGVVPGVTLGALVAALQFEASPAAALAEAAGATLSALAGGWLLGRAADFSRRLNRPRHILTLVAIGAFVAPLAGATLGMAGRLLHEPFALDQLLSQWVMWWARDALGVLLFTPLALAWTADRAPEARSTRNLESVGLALLQVLVYVYVFLTQTGPTAYICLPVSLLSALYLGLRWVVVTNLLTFAIAVVGTARGAGPFTVDSLTGNLLHLQTYGLIASVTMLIVASLAAERRRAGAQLKAAAERFRRLTALSADWYWEQDEQLRFTYVSDGYADRAGVAGTASLGKTRFELGNMFESDEQAQRHAAALAARGPFRDLELRRYDDHGRLRWVAISGEPVFDDKGRFRGYRGVGRDITAGKQAERALRLSEQRLRSLVHLSYDWYWEQDEALRFTVIAGRAADEGRMLPESILGKTRWELAAAELSAEDRRRHDQAVAERRPFHDVVMTHHDAGGEPRTVSISGEPVLDEDGAFRGYRGVARDITLERRAAREIEESRKFLDALIDAIPSPVLVKDGQHRYIAANAAFCRFFRRAITEVTGKTDYEFFGQDDAAFFQATDTQALAGVPVEYERDYVRDGHITRMMVRKSGLTRPDGSRVVVLLLIDVTERKAAEEQLRASEQRFRSLAGLSADWYWEQDQELRYTYVSAEAERKSVTHPSDLIGRTRFELDSDWGSDAVREAHREALLAHRPFRDLLLFDRPSGRHVLVSGEPVLDPDGHFAGYRGVGRDVTEQRRVEQRIARLKEMYAAMTEANEAIIHSSDTAALLPAICRIAVEYGHFVSARVSMIDHATGWVDTVAAAGDDRGRASRFRFSIDPARPEGQGPSAHAMRAGTNYVCNDTAGDERNRPWRDLMDAIGVRAEATFLLRRQAKVAGALHLYAAQVGFFDEELTGMLEKLAANLSYALDNFQREEARRAAEAALRASEIRFRDFADAAGEYVWEADLEGRFTYVSSRVQSVWTYSDQELIGRSAMEFMPPGEAERVRDWLAHNVRADGSFRDLEHRIVTRSGDTRWVLVNAVGILDDQGRRTGQRGTGRDVTDRKTAEARISYLATRDPLTELPNRVLFNDRLEQGIVAARRTGQSLALMFIDLDRFKYINDSLGHPVGDLLLKEVAVRMLGCIRKGDTLSRLGGDEFVVTLEGLQQAEDAAQVAAKIIKALARPFEIASHTLNTSCSIGISIFPLDAEDDRTLMKNADTAMYHAKEKGRNNYQFFSAEMNVRAVERHTLETALRLAIERQEFVLYYQPQVDIRTGKVVGMEALLRWVHPERGLLSPATFIAVAEESGLIEPIGQWALRTACQRARAWQDAGYPPLKIAVNISPRQLLRPREFSRSLMRTLSATGLDPQYLELEMTESLLLRNAEENIAVLRKLGKDGVRIAVDDFGTGYSSLAYLRQLPIDTLKIDRTFVRDIESDPEDAAIIHAVVAMGHSLDLQVTAEGVESMGQLQALQHLGCDEYQGYLFSKPLPAVEIAAKFLAPRSLDFPVPNP